jgi:hypothetical protein
MKKKLFASLLLIPFFSFAQIKGDIAIEWLEKTETSFGDNRINIPQFSGNSYDFEFSTKSLFYVLNLTGLSPYEGNNVQLTNVVYESISISKIGDLDPKNIPKTPSALLKNTESRGLKQSFIVFSPIIKDELGYKRIKSLS